MFIAYRMFSYTTARTIKMGESIDIESGYAIYATPASTAAVVSSDSMMFTILVTDSAITLGLTFAAAALATIAF